MRNCAVLAVMLSVMAFQVALGQTGKDALQVTQVTPASPAVLEAGEKAMVKVRYTCATAEKVKIWVQPYTGGQYTPEGFYAPSGSEAKGEGEVERYVGSKGPAEIDQLRVIMSNADTKDQMVEIFYPVNLKIEGSAPKPEAAAPDGKPFPELKFTSTQGQTVDLSKLKGKVVLVDFWATWCGPCRMEMPNLVTAYEKYRKDGFEIVGISLDEDKGKLEQYLKENKITWPQHFDGKGWKNEIAQRFSVQSIPCSYLLDRQGVVRYMDVRGGDLARAVSQLLKSPGQ